ncbi:FAD-binding protein [Rhodobacter sp. 24-YEA-8]|uniref:FAD-binding protein n=1 Tax=Rhodobacter sp. 24-YEA-8 TaxID=1884310 RepID=UPI000897BFF0|nr:FAD-binding protein [Rhodobacter sp. 24-YEA-8]SED84888.1 glycolate oxidase FAD binding subunit [Rhodobacter sp. 24-YEA-8]
MIRHIPRSEAELSALIARQHQMAAPLVIEGGGSSGISAGIGGEILSTTGLSGVVEYQPGELTLIAQAGTPLAEIEALLSQSDQCLAFEPPDLRHVLGTMAAEPTIGGVVAVNSSGPRRLLSGACRDHILGIRMVDGRGRILRNGGRVMKNVTGLDLSRLLAGSHGTLAVLTEVAIRTLPRAPVSLTLAVSDLAPTAAQALIAKALATPWEVSAAVFHRGRVCLRLEGPGPQVALRRAKLLHLLGCEVEELEGDASRTLWRGFRDLEMFADHTLPLWRLQVRARDGVAIAQRLAEHGEVLTDWGGGLIWYQGAADAALIRSLAPSARLIRRAGLTSARFPTEAEGLSRLSAGLRQVFDPAGIFNQGLMGGSMGAADAD